MISKSCVLCLPQDTATDSLPPAVEITTVESDAGYTSTLTLYNATHEDTGLYECYCGAIEAGVEGHVHHRRHTFDNYKTYIYVSGKIFVFFILFRIAKHVFQKS